MAGIVGFVSASAAGLPVFVGRADGVARLDDLVGAAPIGLITGTAGVGKTALAIHWARRARNRFRDGLLSANLRGYDRDQPATAGEVLDRFLIALGVARRDIPPDIESRAARFRNLVATRQMLLVLDNASSVEQLRPLLPGTASCWVLVTSRDSLPDLVAGYRAQRLELDPLTSAEALLLLRNLVGPRVDADPDAAADLVQHCARLPLALRIVAELANRHSTVPLAELVLELDDRPRRLTILRAGGAAFSWTYDKLPADAARLFRLLGWYPGLDIDIPATAALGQISEHEARELVAVLDQAHLVRADHGRITMHDLLRDYAADLATSQDSATARSAALSALLDHHRTTAARAIDVYAPYEPASARIGPTAFADPAAALAWLDTERANLIAVALYAADHGRPDHTAQISRILFRYLDQRAHFDDEVLLHTAALRTADPRVAMPVLGNYGAVLWRSGRYHDALAHWRHALHQAQHIASRQHEARMRGNLCTVHVRLGNYQHALTLGRQAIAQLHDVESHYGTGITLETLALAYRKLANPDHALLHYQQALATFREIGAPHEGHLLSNIGLTYAQLGYPREALHHQHQALAAVTQPQHQAEIHNNLGITLRLAGTPHQAIPHHHQALTIATHLGDRYEQARAHQQLARTLPNPRTAHHHQTQAHTLHTTMRTPPN